MKKKTNNDIEDQLLTDLFKEFAPEIAPASIKHNAMNRILHEWSLQPQMNDSLINRSNRWWFLLFAFLGLLAILLMDGGQLSMYLENLQLNSRYIDFQSFNESLQQSISFAAKIPIFFYLVFAGGLLLLAIDHFLESPYDKRNNSF